MAMSALIIDDHPLARMAITCLLQNENITVLAEADNGAEGLQLVKEVNPQLVVVDVDIPILNGIMVVEILRKQQYTGIIIVVSAKNDRFYSKRSSDAGANAFVSKKEGMTKIISAINAANSGYSYYPFLLERFTETISSEQEMLESLSLQEINVMHYMLNGVAYGQAAMEMNISCKTVSTYKSRLMAKLGCKSLAEFYAFASRNNIN